MQSVANVWGSSIYGIFPSGQQVLPGGADREV